MKARLAVPAIVLFWTLVLPGARADAPSLTIEISGVSGELLAAVQASLSLYAQKDHPLLNSAVIRSLHRRAPEEIRRALRPFGYYRARVDAALEHSAAGWTARYRIEPGDPIRLSRVEVTVSGPGADDPALQQWRAQFPLHPGDALLHKPYEDAKQDLRQLAHDRGYLDGRFTRHRIAVDLAAYEAAITLEYATGPRYAFGAVTFEQDVFDDSFLQRFVPFQPGTPFSAAQLLELRRALTDSDYFQRIDVVPQLDQAAAGRIPVRVALEPRKPSQYSAGIGYATDTGPRVMLGYDKRWANRYGHRYSTILRRSQIQSSAAARYYVPRRRPATDYLAYTLSWVDENTDTVQRTTSVLGVDLTRQLGDWLRTAGMTYERERYRLGNEADSRLLIPFVEWRRVEADQRVRTEHGWMLGVNVQGASSAVVSDASYAQTRVDLKLIQSLTPRWRVLLRGTGGTSWMPELERIPASHRFLAGGDQSIRGYAYQTLGPANAQGQVTGGKNLLVGSTELEFALTERTSLALFYDAGNAFNYSDFTIVRGAGAGIRLWTPVGAIRLDLARALSRPGDQWRVHLTVGPDL